MIKINSLYPDKNEASAFVSECERSFDSSLENIGAGILADECSRLITLAGPSCSGKTTTAAKLTAIFEKHGKRARVISIDDFYYEKAEMEKMGITDFEGPEAINLPLFTEVLKGLTNVSVVKMPVFDFKTRTRISYAEYIPTSDDIYIFEGIQAIYPEITSVFGTFGYKSIFISVDEGVEVLNTQFSSLDVRLMRRTVRDYFHRATGVAETMKRWPAVIANENNNIYPYVGREDYRVNSLMPYEVFLMSGYYRRIADGCDDDTVRRTVKKLDEICGSAIDISMVPMESVFREFIA